MPALHHLPQLLARLPVVLLISILLLGSKPLTATGASARVAIGFSQDAMHQDARCVGGSAASGLSPIAILATMRLATSDTDPGASVVAERVIYHPDTSVRVRRYTQVRVVALQTGTLDVQIDGMAFLEHTYATSRLLDTPSNRVTGLVHVVPGDVLAITADTAFTIQNLGEQAATSIEVRVALPLPLTPLRERADETMNAGTMDREQVAAVITLLPNAPVDVAIGRLMLSPSAAKAVAANAASILVLGEQGRLRSTSAASVIERAPGEVLVIPPGGRATMHSTGNRLAVALLVMIAPARCS